MSSTKAAQAWMLAHQLGRRNLTPEPVSYLRGKQYQAQQQTVSHASGKHQPSEVQPQSGAQPEKTSSILAAHHKVSRQTLERAAAVAAAVDTASATVLEARHAIVARDTSGQGAPCGPSGKRATGYNRSVDVCPL